MLSEIVIVTDAVADKTAPLIPRSVTRIISVTGELPKISILVLITDN